MAKPKSPAALGLQRKHQLLQSISAQVAEHVSSNTIIVTNLEPDGGTTRIVVGSGDIYARILAAELWLEDAYEQIGR